MIKGWAFLSPVLYQSIYLDLDSSSPHNFKLLLANKVDWCSPHIPCADLDYAQNDLSINLGFGFINYLFNIFTCVVQIILWLRFAWLTKNFIIVNISHFFLCLESFFSVLVYFFKFLFLQQINKRFLNFIFSVDIWNIKFILFLIMNNFSIYVCLTKFNWNFKRKIY